MTTELSEPQLNTLQSQILQMLEDWMKITDAIQTEWGEGTISGHEALEDIAKGYNVIITAYKMLRMVYNFYQIEYEEILIDWINS